MKDALRVGLVAGLATVLTVFGGQVARAAEPATTAFGLADTDGNGTIDVEEYRGRMLEIFVVLDANGDGYLVVAEIVDDHKEMFPVVDSDGNDKVSLREYLVFVMPRFWKADYDGDNVLSLPEVGAADRREAASY